VIVARRMGFGSHSDEFATPYPLYDLSRASEQHGFKSRVFFVQCDAESTSAGCAASYDSHGFLTSRLAKTASDGSCTFSSSGMLRMPGTGSLLAMRRATSSKLSSGAAFCDA
jgi:hypothetical protein